ncbi:MAG: restriction endonuclease subunit S [Nitrospira sp.]|nr:restriction endonuclease subunit S [Nitrospira sp.]
MKLGQVLHLDLNPVPVDAITLYPMVGVLSFGRGLFDREPIENGKTSYRQFYRLKADHIVMSQLFGWEGALALSTEKFAGKFLSPQFPTFLCDENQLDRNYLGWVMRRPSFWEDLGSRASGMGDRRRTLNPEALFACEIPLPLLLEQRRIVARIEALVEKAEEARVLRGQSALELELLLARASSQILDDSCWAHELLETVLAEPPRNGLSPQPEVESNGRPMLRINAVSSSPSRHIDLSAYKSVEVPDDVAKPFVLQEDDVFIVRYNGDIHRVAKAVIFKGENKTMVVYPDKLMRLRTDRRKMLPDFLVYALGSRRVRVQVEELGKTTAGQIGVSGADAKAFEIPVPPLDDQRRIVEYLDGLQAKVDALKKMQAETAAELAAFLPSILDKAFKGEL